MATVDITLDTAKPQEQIEAINGRRGDTGTTIRVTVLKNGEPYDFTGLYLEFAMVRPVAHGEVNWIHLKEGVTQEGETNVWSVTLPEQATAYDGVAKLCYFVVRSETDESFRDSTQRFIIKLDQSATAEAHFGPYSDQVDKLLREAILLTDQWTQQIAEQQEAYEAAEAKRNEDYQTAEGNRDSQFSTAESARQQTFTTAEASRQQTFTTAEQQRQSTFDTNEAQREAESDAATERANTAASQVEELVNGNLTPLMEDWLEENTDKPGGIVSYDKYQSEMVVADGTTLEKNGSTLSVKDGGIGLGKLESGFVLPVEKGGTGVTTDDALYQKVVSSHFVQDKDELKAYLGL